MKQFDPRNRFADATAGAGAATEADGPETNRPETNGPDAGNATGPESARRIFDDLAALSEQAALYLAARRDQIKLGARRALVGLVLGVIGLVVGMAVLGAAAVMLVTGIALGLADALGGRLWLGTLLTGTAILALAALASYLAVRKLMQASRQSTINRYAELHKRQQSRVRRGAAPANGSAGE